MTVSLTVAMETLRDTLVFGLAGELDRRAFPARKSEGTVQFIRSISTVVFGVTEPCLENAFTVGALKLIWLAQAVVV